MIPRRMQQTLDQPDVRLATTRRPPDRGRRRCEHPGCTTVLSAYNPDRVCFAHQPPEPLPSSR